MCAARYQLPSPTHLIERENEGQSRLVQHAAGVKHVGHESRGVRRARRVDHVYQSLRIIATIATPTEHEEGHQGPR